MRSVLIIEDDPAMLRGLKDNFEIKGYRVKTAQDGEQGFQSVLTENPDLVILDIMLPKVNGYEVCRLIRKQKLDMHIIMLTAKDHETDIILGLNLGADDYVTKPFSIKQLLARAEAFIRRRIKDEPDVYEFGGFKLDTTSEILKRDDEEVKLTPGEFKMLHLFFKRTGCPLTCDEIRNTVWGYSHFITLQDIERTVDILNGKIEHGLNNQKLIHNIEGIGYKLEIPQSYGNDFNS